MTLYLIYCISKPSNYAQTIRGCGLLVGLCMAGVNPLLLLQVEETQMCSIAMLGI